MRASPNWYPCFCGTCKKGAYPRYIGESNGNGTNVNSTNDNVFYNIGRRFPRVKYTIYLIGEKLHKYRQKAYKLRAKFSQTAFFLKI